MSARSSRPSDLGICGRMHLRCLITHVVGGITGAVPSTGTRSAVSADMRLRSHYGLQKNDLASGESMLPRSSILRSALQTTPYDPSRTHKGEGVAKVANSGPNEISVGPETHVRFLLTRPDKRTQQPSRTKATWSFATRLNARSTSFAPDRHIWFRVLRIAS